MCPTRRSGTSSGSASPPTGKSGTGHLKSPEPAAPCWCTASRLAAIRRDKLILAPTRHEGAPFLLCDLYARSHHAHLNQPGAIIYYEFANQPLLFMLGYNNRGPQESNLVLVRDAAEDFPHAVPHLHPAALA